MAIWLFCERWTFLLISTEYIYIKLWKKHHSQGVVFRLKVLLSPSKVHLKPVSFRLLDRDRISSIGSVIPRRLTLVHRLGFSRFLRPRLRCLESFTKEYKLAVSLTLFSSSFLSMLKKTYWGSFSKAAVDAFLFFLATKSRKASPISLIFYILLM